MTIDRRIRTRNMSHLAKRPELATIETRLETFRNWPINHPFSKEEIAEAGFFYTGDGDCTRCYVCGGAVRKWQEGDDVWYEHARWFPCCALVQETLGKSVVDAIISLNSIHQAINQESVEEELRNRSISSI